jgi:hypothetical protein
LAKELYGETEPLEISTPTLEEEVGLSPEEKKKIAEYYLKLRNIQEPPLG